MKALEKVNVGIIGGGMMANTMHLPSLVGMEDVRVAALAEMLPDRLEQTASRFGIPAKYRDHREMIEKEDLDAVFVLVRPQHLFDVVIDCLNAGLHVFAEKPPGLTTFQTISMARKAKEKGLLTATGFNRRFIPVLREAKRRVEEQGPVTQVVAMTYKLSTAVYFEGVIDVLTCDAIHAVDTLRWLAGAEPVEVASLISRYGDVTENSWNAVIRFENGVAGVFLSNWMVGGRQQRFEIHSQRISAFVDPDGPSKLLHNNKAEHLDPVAVAGSDISIMTQGFYHQARYFVDCVRSGTEPETSFADSVKTMQLVDRIKGSAISVVN